MSDDIERRILQELTDPDYSPVKPGALARQLAIDGPDRQRFRDALERLIAAGTVREDRRGKLTAKPIKGNVVGILKKVSTGGGYVIPHPGASGPPVGDVFIPAEDLRDAHTGDEVSVKLSKRPPGIGGKRYGRVEEVLERATATFVGVYDERDGRGFVRVDGTTFGDPIAVGDPGAKGAEPGDKVVIEMLRFPTHVRPGEAVLTKVLGPAGEPEVDTLTVIHEFGLATEFPEDALDQAADAAREFDETDLAGREDLTGETIVTIDPADARDFDDAISLSRSEEGHWQLGVHIADVDRFVPAGSPLDLVARQRGTSVYLPGLVIPMLPEVISNGLASLQEGRVRYTKSAFIEFDPEGRMVHTRFADTAIRVTRRFAYEQVMPVVRGAGDAVEVAAPIRKLLGDMHELAMRLRRRRFEAGAIELDLAETKIELDRTGAVTGVRTTVHDESHQIIEEFMLAANVAVATALHDRRTPFIRRIHGDPAEERLRLFAEFVGTLGYPLKRFQSRAELQKLVRAVRGEPAEHPVNYALLRSFKAAEYSVVEEGHYALAFEHYCHFTSPIRRYPDLTIHRQVGRLAAGKKNPGKGGPSAEELASIARKCSEAARRAEAAERELVKIKLLRYMAERVGEELDAVITGVERFGVFCRGTALPVEGLMHVTALGAASHEMFDFDAAAHALIGRTTGWTFQLGRPIRVTVARVDVDARKLDFVPAEDGPPPGERPAKPKRTTEEGRPPRGAKKSMSRPPTSRQPGRRRRGR